MDSPLLPIVGKGITLHYCFTDTDSIILTFAFSLHLTEGFPQSSSTIK